MRLTKKLTADREAAAYEMMRASRPDEPDRTPLTVEEVQAVLMGTSGAKHPDPAAYGRRMMSPGRIYALRRAAMAGTGVPPRQKKESECRSH